MPLSGVEYEAIIRRYLYELWSQGNLSIIDEVTTPAYVRHTTPGALPLDREGQEARALALRAAFPDLEIVPEAFVPQGDTIAFRMVGTATHRGPFQGLEPTGRRVTMAFIDIVRFEGDKMAEHWGVRDDWAISRQLGATLAEG
jgi:predicted ester cyclase